MPEPTIPKTFKQMTELQRRLGHAVQNDVLVYRFASLLQAYATGYPRPSRDLEDKAFFDVMMTAVLIAPELAKLTVGLPE